MKKLICLMFVLGVLLSTAGCISEIDTVKDKSIGVFHDVERIVPVPYFVRSLLETTTIGTGEDKDIFDFEDCDWDVQKYSTVGSYNTRSDKGWFINMEVLKNLPDGGYRITSPSYLYVGHGNHKLYDEAHGLQGYYTPSSLRISQYSGTGGQSGGYPPNYTASGTVRVNSPLFVMKENYVTTYMYYDRWRTGYWNSVCGGPLSHINIKVQLIDATSGYVISEQIFERRWESYVLVADNLSNMEGMWRPVILNGSTYKGRTVFLRIDSVIYSGSLLGDLCKGNGDSFDVYFDEIHFSDEYGDYITYYTSVPPVPNYSYSISDRTVAVNGTSSTDNGTITEYLWSWGDGTQSFGAIDTHQYSADGNYTIQLCVTDDEQMTVCIQKVLNVKTTPETNTAVTGSTTPETSTTTVVTPPVTTAVTTTTPNTTTTSTSTSTSSYTPSANSTTTAQNAFPYWGFFVFCMIVLGFFGVLYFVIKKPKLKGLGRKTKRKVSKK
jgi:PKD repeat protein